MGILPACIFNSGNACVDQLNAFLDACLAERTKYNPELPPPPIPDTQKTGNWLIDATNAALDYCLQDVSLEFLYKPICFDCGSSMMASHMSRKKSSWISKQLLSRLTVI